MSGKKTVRFSAALAVFLLLTAAGLGCAGLSKKTAGRIKVAATLYPLADLVKQVGGDKVNVSILAPAAKNAAKFQILIFSGGEIDSWAGQLIDRTKNKKLLLINASAPGADAQGAAAGPGPVTLLSGGRRPAVYCWLDPIEAQTIVQAISRALSGFDPAGADLYKKNAMHLIVEMANLDWEIRQTLAKNKNKKLPALDPSWAAFAKRYGLPVAPAQTDKKAAGTGVPAKTGLDAFGRSNDPRRSTYLELMRWNLARIIKM